MLISMNDEVVFLSSGYLLFMTSVYDLLVDVGLGTSFFRYVAANLSLSS